MINDNIISNNITIDDEMINIDANIIDVNIDIDDLEEDVILNDDWLKNEEETNELYKDYYKDDVYYINTFFIYVNKKDEIEKIKSNHYFLKEKNKLLRNEIIELLKHNIIDNNVRYNLLSILKYNIDLDTEDVKYFLNSTTENNHFLLTIKHISDIYFEPTIHMFQDLNDIIFVLKDNFTTTKTKENTMLTKKIIIKKCSKKTKKHPPVHVKYNI